ncbi:MAG: hypothetical protein N0E38_04515 [Candidatus Thiodiazotropha endolucinida]|nr:hypothetical protein [Candidatus Thiodiazotropha taylori]MCW4348210.1 hypothetical protein [Candidatus Thiodiazotropha endolucinida]
MSSDLIFDKNWMKKSHPEGSWAKQAIEDYSNSGVIYLQELSDWYKKYPGSNKRKNGIKAGLLNSDNFAHLGAVNELSWWAYINSRGGNISPIPEGKNPTADCEIQLVEITVICEVTTVNVSLNESIKSLQQSQINTKKRIVNKATKEKLPQFIYGSNRECPVILVLFNYDEWSGFGTKPGRNIVNYISHNDIPKELSAIVYLERYVIKRKSMYKNDSTSVFQNPNAQFSIGEGVIESLMETDIEWSPCEKA